MLHAEFHCFIYINTKEMFICLEFHIYWFYLTSKDSLVLRVMLGKLNDTLSTDCSFLCSGASFISFTLEVYLSLTVFSGSAVLWWLAVMLQVLEQWHTHTQHTHKDSIVWPQTSAYLYSLPLPYFAHHNARCSKCACVCVCVYTVALLMYSTAQCVQIILANNFLFPVSDSATSCPLSHMDSCPKKTWQRCLPQIYTIHLRPLPFVHLHWTHILVLL